MKQVPQMIRTRAIRHELTNVSPPDERSFRQDPETLRRKLIVDALRWAAEQCNASKHELLDALNGCKLKSGGHHIDEEKLFERSAPCRPRPVKQDAQWRSQIVEFCRENPNLSSRQCAEELTRQGVPCSSETVLRAKRAAKSGTWQR